MRSFDVSVEFICWCFAVVFPYILSVSSMFSLLSTAAATKLTEMASTCAEKLSSPSVCGNRLSSFVCWTQKVLRKIHDLFYLLQVLILALTLPYLSAFHYCLKQGANLNPLCRAQPSSSFICSTALCSTKSAAKFAC